jgi:histidine ammonia-lyase
LTGLGAIIGRTGREPAVTVVVDGASLTLDHVARVVHGHEPVALSPDARTRMVRSRERVERVLGSGMEVYGLTTGLGERKRHRVAVEDQAEFNRRVVETSRVGTGPPATAEVVRATMLCLANRFAKATTPARPVLVDRLVGALNADQRPLVRSLGSLGMTDLAPLGDLAHGVLGDLELAAGEGLALVNNNAFSTGASALAVLDARRLTESLTVAAALDMEAFAANLTVLDEAVATTRPYPGARDELSLLRRMLAGSHLWSEVAARNLQDPLSFRSIVQVHGALRDSLAFAEQQLAVELNAHDSNPLLVPDQDRVISVGSYDVLPVAAALDFVRIALAPALTSAMERTTKLLQAPLSGLPSGLAPVPGVAHGGLGEIGFVIHALAAEARLLAQPVSFELATTTLEEGLADRASMAHLSARRLADQVDLAWRILGIELAAAAQAVSLRRPPTLGVGTELVQRRVRERLPVTGVGRPSPTDLDPVVDLARSGGLICGLAANDP